MDLSQRSYQKELLDRDDIPFHDIRRNMEELNFINTWLGGHAITLTGLKKLLFNHDSKFQEVLICEIGCGGGDNIKAISTWCKKNNINASFIGIDINADCIKIANAACKEVSAEFIHSDYQRVNFQKKPGIIFSSLFCHHFSNHQLVDMLHWMKENSVAGFFINDLHRHTIAYYSIKWLSGIFSKSYLVKNDAPLSVARGFKKEEWVSLLRAAAISPFAIEWKWAFRWLIVAPHSNEFSSKYVQPQHSRH